VDRKLDDASLVGGITTSGLPTRLPKMPENGITVAPTWHQPARSGSAGRQWGNDAPSIVRSALPATPPALSQHHHWNSGYARFGLGVRALFRSTQRRCSARCRRAARCAVEIEVQTFASPTFSTRGKIEANILVAFLAYCQLNLNLPLQPPPRIMAPASSTRVQTAVV